MPKTLVIHASAGAGHKKCAEAIEKGIKGSTAHDTTLIDALDYTNPFYKKMYQGGYAFLISRIPFVWKIVFGALDLPLLQPLIRLARRTQNAYAGAPLARFLTDEKFDYIISTHFFPNEVVSFLKGKGMISAKLISVITDFDVHRIWVAKNIDSFAVATDWTKGKLKSLNVPAEKIFISGIPTDEKFSLPKDKSQLKRRLGLKENIFTVLVATGSFGIGPIEHIVEALKGFQVLVVCGHNKGLLERLQKYAGEAVKIYGLVNNMDELMAASEAMVTKPGGLSIAEALVSSLPLVFFNAIPGQETNNIRVLQQYGIGTQECSVGDIVEELQRLKDSAVFYEQTVKKIKNLARPHAVSEIVKLIKL